MTESPTPQPHALPSMDNGAHTAPLRVEKLTLHRTSKVLHIQLSNAHAYSLSAEYLRVYSPSAEVRGHGKATLQTGKLNVGITDIQPVGHYGVRLYFDDNHNTGLYSWPYLIDLCTHQETRWQRYLTELEDNNASRDPHESTIRWSNPPPTPR
ncbi:MAG: DUF971 domain-containing protein [Gammaproteobacteria bacterium]